MSNDPLTIPLDKLLDLVRGLGLDPVDANDLKSIHMDAGTVTVVRFRRDEAGMMRLAGDGLSVLTETVTIKVTW